MMGLGIGIVADVLVSAYHLEVRRLRVPSISCVVLFSLLSFFSSTVGPPSVQFSLVQFPIDSHHIAILLAQFGPQSIPYAVLLGNQFSSTSAVRPLLSICGTSMSNHLQPVTTSCAPSSSIGIVPVAACCCSCLVLLLVWSRSWILSWSFC